MRTVINKNKFFEILFIICVAVPYLNNYELTFAVWFATVLISLQKSYSKNFIVLIGSFLMILTTAFLVSFFCDNKLYDFIRDFTYLLKPIFGLLIGYQICKSNLKNPLKTAVNAGVFIAVIHLYIVFFSFFFRGIRNIHELRFNAGYFSDYEIYVLILIIFNIKFKIDLSTKTKTIYIALLTLSSLFYLSRINLIQFIILFLAVKGYFRLNKKTLIALSSIILSFLLAYSAILFINPKRNGAGVEAFLYKLKIAPTEPFKTKIKFDDYKDFNDNYRSYENIMTVKQSYNIDNFKIYFGQGLGSKVNLHREVLLDGVLMDSISIMHNGFTTIFLKSGLLGVLLLLLSIFYLTKNYSPLQSNKYLNYLITGSVLFLILSYWVFMGFYFKADTKSIFIGLLIALIEKNKSNIALQN